MARAFVRNREFRSPSGYEQEVARNLTLGVQYDLEIMLDLDAYPRTLPAGTAPHDEHRHVLTQRPNPSAA